MKKLLEYLLKSIVLHPEKVLVNEEKEGSNLIFKIKAHDEDLKIIIGKKGQTIKALREITRIKALKEGYQINLQVEG